MQVNDESCPAISVLDVSWWAATFRTLESTSEPSVSASSAIVPVSSCESPVGSGSLRSRNRNNVAPMRMRERSSSGNRPATRSSPTKVPLVDPRSSSRTAPGSLPVINRAWWRDAALS